MKPTLVQEMRAHLQWGCSYQQYTTLGCKPKQAFAAQRGGARTRGIGWKLTLWQWWTIWQESGHWDHRGSGQGYVMCRRGDVGPYAVGNVFIAPNIENASDGSKATDLPIGVATTRNKMFRAARYINGKRRYLGIHATPELAHAAYLSLGPIHKPPQHRVHSNLKWQGA